VTLNFSGLAGDTKTVRPSGVYKVTGGTDKNAKRGSRPAEDE